jgi:hypothetical protein
LVATHHHLFVSHETTIHTLSPRLASRDGKLNFKVLKNLRKSRRCPSVMALVVPPARERRDSSRGSLRRGSRLLGDAWLAALPATGATEWTSADCCLLVHHLVLELEGDEDLARDAAVAWRQHQIDGACLAGLTPALLLEIYRSDARLGRLGLRLRLRKRLEAFLVSWDVGAKLQKSLARSNRSRFG